MPQPGLARPRPAAQLPALCPLESHAQLLHLLVLIRRHQPLIRLADLLELGLSLLPVVCSVHGEGGRGDGVVAAARQGQVRSGVGWAAGSTAREGEPAGAYRDSPASHTSCSWGPPSAPCPSPPHPRTRTHPPTRVLVGVPLERQLAEGGLGVGLGGAQRQAQRLVVAGVAHVVQLALQPLGLHAGRRSAQAGGRRGRPALPSKARGSLRQLMAGSTQAAGSTAKQPSPQPPAPPPSSCRTPSAAACSSAPCCPPLR